MLSLVLPKESTPDPERKSALQRICTRQLFGGNPKAWAITSLLEGGGRREAPVGGSLDRSAVNCLSSAQAELPQSASLTAPSKRGLKQVESTTRQRPIAVGDAVNLYRLGIAALV